MARWRRRRKVVKMKIMPKLLSKFCGTWSRVRPCAAFVHSNPFQLSFIPQNKRGNNNLKMSKSFHLDRSDPGRAKLSPDCSFELGGAVGPAAEAEPNKGIRGSHPRTSVDDTGGSGLETALGLV